MRARVYEKQADQLHLYLLGSPQLEWQGQPLPVARRQVRALLYRLAVSPLPVARDELLALFWPETPDDAARRSLSRLFSYLRQVLPHKDMLHVTVDTVALNPKQVWCDAVDLLGVKPANDPDETLAVAVSLRHGPFLSGFTLPRNYQFEDWLRLTERDLERQHLAVLAELTARKTTAADHAAAIQYAQQYLAVDNLAEEVHRRLIRLYVLTGDRAAAQQQYEQCTLILERELGVPPLPETRAAYEDALPERPQPPAPVIKPQWAALPSLDIPLIGRETSTQQLEQARQRLEHGGMILITGEAGIGKSRLMQTFADRADTVVLAGAAHAGAQSVPYVPLLQALRPLAEYPELLAAVSPTWLSEALPLLPDLRRAFPNLPPSLPQEPDQAQTLHFEALVQLLLGVAQTNPVWLCLEDLQWVDGVTLAWLSYLIDRLPGSHILVLATIRSQNIDTVADLRRHARRAGLLAEISPGPLDTSAVEKLLAQLEPAVSDLPWMAQRLHSATGGNPFFLLEIIRTLLEVGDLNTPPDTLPIPSSIRDVVATRLNRLSSLAKQLLETAAVLETDLRLPLLTEVSGRQDDETVAALDELAEHQLLLVADRTVSFQHDLIRVTVLDELTFWRRQLLHRRAAEALEAHPPMDWPVAANHWAAAETWTNAVAAYTRASRQAIDLSAYDVALELVHQGLNLLPQLSHPRAARLQLLTLRLQIYQALLQMPEWEADLAEVEHLTNTLADEAVYLQVLESRLSLLALQSNLPELESTADCALGLAGQMQNRHAEARIHHALGWHLAEVAGRPTDGLPHLQSAVELAQAVGDDRLHYHALCHLAYCLRSLGRCHEALTCARQALTLVPETTYPHPAQANALEELAETSGYLAHWQEAREDMLKVVQLFETIQDPWALGASLYNLGLFTAAMGQYQEAIAAMERVVQIGVEVGLPPDSEFGIIHRTGLIKVLVRSEDVAAATLLYNHLHLPDSITGRARIDYALAGGELALAQEDWATAFTRLNPIITMLQEQSIMHFAYGILFHALAAHRLGNAAAAHASLSLAETLLKQGDCVHSARYYHFMGYQITGDPAHLAAAHAELQRQANHFTDAALRNDFLQNVRFNRDILAAWEAVHSE